MNKLFRLLYTILFSHRRPSVDFLGACDTPFRVYPADLDVLRHMNNGVYFSLQDLARVDLMIRCGVKGVLDQNGWYPVITAETLTFKRSLKLWQKFYIRSQVIGWTDKAFVLAHHHMVGEQIYAEGLITARFLKKSGGGVKPKELLETAGFPSTSPPIPANILQKFDLVTR